MMMWYANCPNAVCTAASAVHFAQKPLYFSMPSKHYMSYLLLTRTHHAGGWTVGNLDEFEGAMRIIAEESGHQVSLLLF